MKPITPIIIDSWIPWPVLTILWWIHGNEVCWVQTLDILSQKLNIKRWKVFLMYGNLRAIDTNARQIDCNLNRMFRDDATMNEFEMNSYEYLRSREIMKYLDQSIWCLDLHSSPSFGSPALIITEEACNSIIEWFPFSRRCYGFSEMEPGWTDGYMFRNGKVGICVECWYHKDSDAFLKWLESVKQFLSYYDMLDDISIFPSDFPKEEIRTYRAKTAYKTQTDTFRVVKIFSDFEDIIAGQLIWYDDFIPVYAENTGSILFARDRNQKGVEWFVEIISA